jgi:hypothetical protein
MYLGLLLLATLISLSHNLTLPIYDSAWPSLLLNGTSDHDPQITSESNLTASHLGAWPPLPFTSDTGRHLNITVTRLGPTTAPALRDQILSDINTIHATMAREGNHYATLDKAYTRSSGIVTVFYGSKPGADLKRYHAIRIISLVWVLMIEYEPREILIAQITLGDITLATLALRFFQAGS